MLILHFYKDVQLRVLYVKALLGHNPPFASIGKEVLMKISNSIAVGFIYLPKALVGNDLLNAFTIDLCIECELYGVYDIMIEIGQCNFPAVSPYGIVDMLVNAFV